MHSPPLHEALHRTQQKQHTFLGIGPQPKKNANKHRVQMHRVQMPTQRHSILYLECYKHVPCVFVTFQRLRAEVI